MTTRALQVESWENPLTGETLKNLFAIAEKFSIDIRTNRYEGIIKVYVSEAAYIAGRRPVAIINYANGDGVYPHWNDAMVDINFVLPLLGLRKWAYDVLSVRDNRFLSVIPVLMPVTLTSIDEDSGLRLITQAELLSAPNENKTATNLVILEGKGTLTDNGNGTWGYTPAKDDSTSVAFSYNIVDNGTIIAIGGAELDIIAVNDPPVANDVSASGPQGGDSINIKLTGTDVDGQVSSFRLINLPQNGKLYTDVNLSIEAVVDVDYSADDNSCAFYFVPAVVWNGTTTFQFTAKDNEGATSNNATGTITVTPMI